MPDYPIVDGDFVQFMPNFAAALVAVNPGKIRGTGKAVGGKKLCVDGDEASVEVNGCVYMTPQFSIPGTGTLKIAKLNADQLSITTKDSGKNIILKGNYFVAKFQVQSPAKDPATATPDPSPSYPGTGQFMNTNFKVTIK